MTWFTASHDRPHVVTVKQIGNEREGLEEVDSPQDATLSQLLRRIIHNLISSDASIKPSVTGGYT